MRKKKFLYSFFSSILGQGVTIICGMILPAYLIRAYGSTVYGATTSITQFLSYISLLEGGIGGVARAALYKPLANRDINEVSRIIACIKSFFQKIAFTFVIYTIILACNFQTIAKENYFDWQFTFWLVLVISFSSIAQYYFGISYNILLQADQKTYITTMLNMGTTLLNTVIACVMASFRVNIILLKLVWSLVHFLRIFVLNCYIRKNYALVKCKPEKDCMPQKWSGLGQHIAYYLHNNTDVAVLTIFVGLKEVSVYAVYNYIVRSLYTGVMTFVSNMEGIYGDMLARNQKKELDQFISRMEFLINTVACIAFSTAMVAILPFVALYTRGVTDAEYQRPLFAMILLLAQLVTCIRQPYHVLAIAAGHFRQTAWAAYVEAASNIGISVLLCYRYGIVGVAFGTLISVLFRTIYYIFYLSRNIVNRPVKYAMKRMCLTFVTICVSFLLSDFVLSSFGDPQNYFCWALFSMVAVVISGGICLVVSLVFYKKETIDFINQVKSVVQKVMH